MTPSEKKWPPAQKKTRVDNKPPHRFHQLRPEGFVARPAAGPRIEPHSSTKDPHPQCICGCELFRPIFWGVFLNSNPCKSHVYIYVYMIYVCKCICISICMYIMCKSHVTRSKVTCLSNQKKHHHQNVTSFSRETDGNWQNFHELTVCPPPSFTPISRKNTHESQPFILKKQQKKQPTPQKKNTWTFQFGCLTMVPYNGCQ